MKLKIAFAALALSLSPALAFAQCASQTSAASCPAEQIWDSTKGQCVTKPNA